MRGVPAIGRIAFAIRNCSLLTESRTSGQLMACQSEVLPEDAPMDKSIVICFSSFGGSAVSFAKRDQTDVGISGALHTGLGLFGLLNAGSASLPCGLGGHDQRGPELQRFHVLHTIREGFRSALVHRQSVSTRRATLDDPDSTACLLAEP